MINIGLGDVLFDPKTKQIYTPNTNKIVKMGELNNDDKQTEENKQPNSEEVDGGEQIEE